MHIGNQRCDSCDVNNGCYSLYKPSSFMTMINETSRNKSISTDFFLELWLSKLDRQHINISEMSTDVTQNSALGENISWLMKCITRDKRIECPLPNIRTHMSDTRSEEYSLVSILYDIRKYSGVYNGIYTLKNIIKEKYNIDPNEIFDLIERILYNKFDVMEVFTHPFFNKSRLKHEFNQLPISIQYNIKKSVESIKHLYTETDTFTLSSNFKDIFKEFMDYLKNPSINISNIIHILKDIVTTLITLIQASYFNTCLVDIYTVSRILKTFKGGLPSQLSIVYLGARHGDNIMKLLSGYYDVFQTYGNPEFMKDFYQTIGTNAHNEIISKKCLDENNDEFTEITGILHQAYRRLINAKNHNAIENWVKTYSNLYDMPLSDANETRIEKPLTNEEYPRPLNSTKQDLFKGFTRMYSSGNKNDCLIHAIFNSLSGTFRQLSQNDKDKVADYFRRNVFTSIIEQSNDINGFDENQKKEMVAQLKSIEFLTDQHIKFIVNKYNINAYVFDLGRKWNLIRPITTKSDYVIIIYNPGKGHYESVKSNDGVYIFSKAFIENFVGFENSNPNEMVDKLKRNNMIVSKSEFEEGDSIKYNNNKQYKVIKVEYDNTSNTYKYYIIQSNEPDINTIMKSPGKYIPFNGKIDIRIKVVVDTTGYTLQLNGGKRYKKSIKQHKKMKITTQKAHKYNKKYKTQKKRLI